MCFLACACGGGICHKNEFVGESAKLTRGEPYEEDHQTGAHISLLNNFQRVQLVSTTRGVAENRSTESGVP